MTNSRDSELARLSTNGAQEFVLKKNSFAFISIVLFSCLLVFLSS